MLVDDLERTEETPKEDMSRAAEAMNRDGSTLEDLIGLINANAATLQAVSGLAPGAQRAGGPSLIVGQEGCAGEFQLWLGGVDDAINMEFLRKREVSAVVNMAARACQREKTTQIALNAQYAPFLSPEALRWTGAEFNEDWYRRGLGREDARYLALDCEDREEYQIWQHFAQVSAFLRTCREEKRVVLVHCIMGVNRSPSACVAFLMHEGLSASSEGLGVAAAVDWVSRRRRGILQNRGFLQQLLQHGSSSGSQSAASDGATNPSLLDTAASNVNAPASALHMIKRGASGRTPGGYNSVRRGASGSLATREALRRKGGLGEAAPASSLLRLKLAGGNGGETPAGGNVRVALEQLLALQRGGKVSSSPQSVAERERRAAAAASWDPNFLLRV
eukprot:TRINITY_DN4280_c0_g1_i1.p1 TRINITY_DN4280_c0_g1~~TRINITY_DN4280_c0_g1_i1.p1  ORF type:complete len:391 (-),score=84.55 TRINITY_DN4280_c0_g1_i1:267-1439(-)